MYFIVFINAVLSTLPSLHVLSVIVMGDINCQRLLLLFIEREKNPLHVS